MSYDRPNKRNPRGPVPFPRGDFFAMPRGGWRLAAYIENSAPEPLSQDFFEAHSWFWRIDPRIQHLKHGDPDHNRLFTTPFDNKVLLSTGRLVTLAEALTENLDFKTKLYLESSQSLFTTEVVNTARIVFRWRKYASLIPQLTKPGMKYYQWNPRTRMFVLQDDIKPIPPE